MTAARTILIDLRATQFNGDRGIPAYAQSLAVELVRSHPGHHWLLWHDPSRPLPTRAAELAAHAAWRTTADLAAATAPPIDAVLTGCFFLPDHRCDGEALYPDWLRRRQPRRLGVVYDLVPLLFPDRYLARPRARQQYHDCLRVMRRSDQLFAISRATRRDVIRHAAVDPARVHCIYGDIDHAKRALMAWSAAETAAVPARHGLRGRYCACVGGEDWRKNMDAAVLAFADFHRDHPDHQLAIICKLSAARIAELEAVATAAGLPAGAVVCTGYVSDQDLVPLVAHAEMLVYPSRYEGLGLPVLEAYGCGTPVVGSNTSSVAELVIPELACDPENPTAIAAAMRRLSADPALAEASLAFGRRLLAEELGWERAAAAVMEQLEDRPPSGPTRGPGRPRVAVVAALPPARTGIARYTLRHLQSDHWQTTFYDATPGPRLAPQTGLLPTSRVVPAETFPAAALRGRHAVAIFVLGNSPHHVKVLEALMRSRGGPLRRLAYLHEAALDSLFRAWLGGDLTQLPEPPPGRSADDDQHPAWIGRALAAKPDLGRCLRLLAEQADLEGVIVNSKACCDLVRAALGSLANRWRIEVAFHPVEEPASAPPGLQLHRPAADKPLVIGSFGLAGDTKQLDLVTQAAAVIGRRRPVRLLIAGWEASRYCRRLGPIGTADLEVIDAPDDGMLAEAMRRVDVAVQLRTPTFGESSGVVCQLLALGTPLVVTGEGSFAELPADAAVLVPAACSTAELARKIEAAAARPIAAERRREIVAVLAQEAFAARIAAILSPVPC
jgi:glycosyltransferase involved in cell wall biosynthesis